ncbi:hypothetical protein CVT26_007454 [Gymnopilus dilepis]|uniref:CCHC-type domain-containing protein n=1 Tax=Gymnopilus dilepis TaxID=231916 RepID=A0A409WLQ1_9AGAR|nr:hypothetical protein CVT26_007454 [Gymnopilus dilepis]
MNRRRWRSTRTKTQDAILEVNPTLSSCGADISPERFAKIKGGDSHPDTSSSQRAPSPSRHFIALFVMSEVDTVLAASILAGAARKVNEQLMSTIDSLSSMAKDVDSSKMALKLLDSALGDIVTPALRDVGSQIRDGSGLCHRIFAMREAYHTVQKFIDAAALPASNVYPLILDISRAIQGRRLVEKERKENESCSAPPPATPAPVLAPAAVVAEAEPATQAPPKVPTGPRRRNRVPKSPEFVNSDDDAQKEASSVIDLSDDDSSSQRMVVDDGAVTTTSPPTPPVPVSTSRPRKEKAPARASVVLIPFSAVPGIDMGRSFVKAQRVISGKCDACGIPGHTRSRCHAASTSKKPRLSRDTDIVLSDDITSTRANRDSVRARIANLEFEIVLLRRQVEDLREQEGVVVKHLDTLLGPHSRR